MSRFKNYCLFVLFLLILLPAATSFGEETIRSFQSDIKVTPDGIVHVTETIQVMALGLEIKRGIYRDFPTDYKTKWGFNRTTSFEVKQALRDGKPEPFHFERQSNGMRLYLGDKDVMIPSGIHTYTISYQSRRQLGFFPDHDELYWNVTGNGWVFPIEAVRARVTLPPGIKPADIKVEGYTGYQGDTDRFLTATVDKDGSAVFSNQSPLLPKQGLTLVVSFPKGFVSEPNENQKKATFFFDNLTIVTSIGALLGILLYYLFMWFKVGRDPKQGVIVPLFEAPDNLSPSATRYIWKMGYDPKVFAAAVIQMAVQKRLVIEERGSGFTLKNLKGGNEKLSHEEAQLYINLLYNLDELDLKASNGARISAAVSKFKEDLRNSYEKAYFLTNRGYFYGGIALTLVALIAAFLTGGASNAAGLFMIFWLTGWTFAVVHLLNQAWHAWIAAWNSRGIVNKAFSFFGAGIASVIALPFFAGEIIGLFMLGKTTSYWLLPVVLLAVAINVVFFVLLKAPTLGGRKVLDHIEGLRMYLGTAEQERLAYMTPPEKTPALFEKFLPYALALDVENEWAEQFADVLAKSGMKPQDYSPAWYAGTAAMSAGALTSSLSGSLTSAISSSSSPPGSSSGGGGGGSSGGGGGGGGGGGW